MNIIVYFLCANRDGIRHDSNDSEKILTPNQYLYADNRAKAMRMSFTQRKMDCHRSMMRTVVGTLHDARCSQMLAHTSI